MSKLEELFVKKAKEYGFTVTDRTKFIDSITEAMEGGEPYCNDAAWWEWLADLMECSFEEELGAERLGEPVEYRKRLCGR